MHFHLPKPLHGWRQLAGEVGIIVVGVLIALAAEQLVETLHWREKVTVAKKSIDYEVNAQLNYADEVVWLHKCSGPFVDTLEAAIVRQDSKTIGLLHDTRPPVEPRPWRSTAWQSAMSTQIADHLDSHELAEDAFFFSGFDDLMKAQDSIVSNFGDATVGRLAAPADAASMHGELVAAERLRTQLELEFVIANTLVETAADGQKSANWKPIVRRRYAQMEKNIPVKAALCERTVVAARNDLRGG